MSAMIFRDDDICVTTDLAVFKPVHENFRKAMVMHTVAIICKDFQLNNDLVNFIKANNIDPQIHCWEHVSLPDLADEQLRIHFAACLRTFKLCGFDRPTTIYPPWNKNSWQLRSIASEFNLTVSSEKVSLSYYLKHKGNVTPSVINFHHWDEECEDLPLVLELYNTKRP